MGLLAKDGELVALLCMLCVFFRLLLTFHVEFALAAASAAVGACCLLACGARNAWLQDRQLSLYSRV